jgi:hypothetical protein
MESTKSLTKSTTSRKKVSVASNAKSENLVENEQFARIAVTAYYKAQARGFQPGHELEDWLTAEAEEKP